ncbi:class I SAM-dependent methyltransferase [Candidatus Actinomarina sp.]|nr:class I SAM-dependent methyltransferase [Candidatus Actinomarina sp.]
MRFFRNSDLDENSLKIEFKKEFEYVEMATNILNTHNPDQLNLGNATLSNLYHFTRRYEYVFFSKYIENLSSKNTNISIMDVGCGVSYAPYTFSKLVKNYTAIDKVDLSLFYDSLSNDVKFFQHDIVNKPFKLDSFDLAISISVLEHIPTKDRHKSIENIYKSLKKGGKFAITFDIDLESSGGGINFDELIYTISYMKSLGFNALEEIDLTTYNDILTSESILGLPANRYQLPWRINYNHSGRIYTKLKQLDLVKPKHKSLAVVFGVFQKN